MTSPYLNLPLIPLTTALPRMLQKIEADLDSAGPAEKSRLRRRAELIRGLLEATGRATPAQASPPQSRDRLQC